MARPKPRERFVEVRARIPLSLRERLRRDAEAQKRTLNRHIEYILERASTDEQREAEEATGA
jgi:predicted HicB family RNase H-like nuclease